uniref:XPG N-terminal domain-containing protein n=1 Tax=viral metagenome TaxID=1070528 RepID=A0A6C0JKX0_9ZZZZ
MGIRYLNKYFREECKNSDAIKIVTMAQLSGKKIAVDISIYLYKFASDDTLIENMYSMLSIFRHYNIVPIFVFDGKPPAEKKELLLHRLAEKKTAEKEFNQLKTNLDYNTNMDEDEKHEIINKMDILKKKFVYISKNQIDDVKSLITNYGMTYCYAPGEADELCAMFVMKGIAWACLSEDMDTFVYGCPHVLRYLSLMNHTFVLYDTKKILNKLGMNQNELREVCVISGTDYNLNNKYQYDLYTTMKYFKKYKNHTENEKDVFYSWLLENTNYVKIHDIDLFKKTYDLFYFNELNDYEKIKIANTIVMHSELRKILKKDGFIFAK